MSTATDPPPGASNSESASLRDRLTREAMAEVDSGRGIDDTELKAWADSLGGPNPLPSPTPRP